MWLTLSKVFCSSFWYPTLLIVISTITFTLAIWLPNLSLILDIIFGSASVSNKLNFLWSLYFSLATNFTWLSASITSLLSLLFGLNLTLLVYYFKKRKTGLNLGFNGTSSLGGILSGFLGVGCAACGSFFLFSFLNLFGATGLLFWLPFGGVEFGFLGLVLLLYSNKKLLEELNNSFVCRV